MRSAKHVDDRACQPLRSPLLQGVVGRDGEQAEEEEPYGQYEPTIPGRLRRIPLSVKLSP
jgi:hypothetical protein